MNDLSQYAITLKAFAGVFFTLGGWGYGAGYNAFFLLYYPVWGKKNTETCSRGLLAVLVMLVIQLLAYFAVFILAHHDVEWHLSFSLDRILLHIYPTLLFVLFSITDDPENVFRTKEPAPLEIGTR